MTVVNDEDHVALIRANMTQPEILAEFNNIWQLAQKRFDSNSPPLRCIRSPYPLVDSGSPLMHLWLTEFESLYVHRLKLALPTSGEDVLAAKERIRQRIAARKSVSKSFSPTCLDSDLEIRQLGIATITDIGNENVYVLKDGIEYYFKPPNNSAFQLGCFDFSEVVVFDLMPKMPTGVQGQLFA